MFRHTAVWKKKRADQQNFIRSQDYLTRRCVRLYEEADTTSQHSSISIRSVNDHHVGFIYVPPFRPFMFGRVEDKSVLYDSTDAYSNTGSDTPTNRYRGNSNAGSMASLHQSNHSEILYDDSGEESEGSSDNDMDDSSYIARSSKSTDSESFHTAQGSDDEEYQVEDHYFMASATGSEYSGDDSSADEQELEQQQGNNPSRQSYTPDKNLTAAIPPSIPYSDYLRRYKVSRSNSEYHGGFFHPYIPPSRPNFIPENVSNIYDVISITNANGPFVIYRDMRTNADHFTQIVMKSQKIILVVKIAIDTQIVLRKVPILMEKEMKSLQQQSLKRQELSLSWSHLFL